MLEIYQLSLLDWWRNRLHWRDVPIPVIMSTPDRAFGTMSYLLSKARGDKDSALKRDQNIPLPFAALSMPSPEEYDGTRDNAGVIRAMYVNEELTESVNVDWPTPVKLNFQLDIWCETLRQQRHFYDEVRRYFKFQRTYIDIDFNSGEWELEDGAEMPMEVKLLGKRQIPMKINNWTDASNLEPGDGNREIRMNLSMSLDAWMARGYTMVPLVRSFELELYDYTDNTLLSDIAIEP